MKNHLPGIDKLAIYTPDFRINDANNGAFAINRTIKQGQTESMIPHLLTDKKGKDVMAWNIYRKSEVTNAIYDIKKIGANVSMLISFNPSKMAHPYILSDIESHSFNQSLSRIEKEMESIGISCSLQSSKLTRVDMAKQTEMKFKIYQYEDAFKMLKGKRMKEKKYENGYQFANKQHACQFYDKVEEMKFNKLEYNLQGEVNLMRGEVRALNSDGIQSNIRVSTLSDILKIGNDGIMYAYHNYMNKKIFSKRNESHQLVIDWNNEVETLKFCMDQNKRKGWMEYLAMDGIETKINQIGGLDKFLQLLEDAGFNRQHKYKVKQQVNVILEMKAKCDNAKNIVSPSTLLDELMQNFALYN
jgi:hypothetical protein